MRRLTSGRAAGLWVRAARFAMLLAVGACLLQARGALGETRSTTQEATTPTESLATERTASLARVTALRDAFVQRVLSEGFTCLIAPPKIVMEDVPSFGQYNTETNTLRTADWTAMSTEGRQFFARLARPGASEAEVRERFEQIAHRWIFVHELGHWWQACRHLNAGRSPYAIEYEADRIAFAYWREAGPEVVSAIMAAAHGMIAHAPNPVPAGQDVETYFDAHYEELGPTPAYPWFQAKMIVSGDEERPVPSFAAALASAGKAAAGK